jgi:cytochrome b561
VDAPATSTIAPTRWDSWAKALHWGIALAILLEVPAGFVMASTYGPSFRDEGVLGLHRFASQFHHTLGLLLLAAALAWLLRRLRRPRPPAGPAVPPWQRRLAGSVHALLALLLLIVPLSGWAALSALADSPQFGPTHLWFFGFDRLLPRIWAPLPFDDPMGYRLLGAVHVRALWLGLALLALHVAAALWHHAVRRDGVLRRMWPLAELPGPE